MTRTNRPRSFRKNDDGVRVQPQDKRDKQMVKKKRKRVNGRSGAPALLHCPAAVEAAPSPEKSGECAHRLADHTLLRKGRRYPEARDLRWTKYGCCSSSIVTCYDRRFLNVQPHSIPRGTAPTDLAAVMEAALAAISGKLFVHVLLSVLCPLLSGCLAYGTFVAAVAAMLSVLAWACLSCSCLAFCFRFC